MLPTISPDVLVYVCKNCVPTAGRLPRQWMAGDARVLVREVPCSGKIDGQYLLHALEGGSRGLCVVACPKGECLLAQGNYRAEVRIRTVQRLLAEVGMEPDRAQWIHGSAEDPPERLRKLIDESVERILDLGASPVGAAVGAMP